MKNILILLAFIPIILGGCATGSAIVTGTVRPAIPVSEVKLYIEAPEEYEVIGIVEASSAVEFTSQGAQDRAIEELKKQASKLGANGVILMNSGDRQGDTVGYTSGGVYYSGTETVKTAQAKAIYIAQE